MCRNTRNDFDSLPFFRRQPRKIPKFVQKPFRFENLEARMMLAGDTMHDGDHNGDGNISGADFLQWQQTSTTENTSTAQTELAAWDANYGANHGGGNHGHTGHPANPAAMALVSLDQATNTVVASGNWSDPSVWQNGTLPTAGARIVIPEGMTLTVDGQIAEEFKTIRIDGTLQFATNTNTELRVDTIVSSPTGCFVMGTSTNPIAANVTARVVFTDDGAIDQKWDPQQLSRGALLQGPVDIHGAETTHRVTLASHPAAGATSIQLKSVPTGWNVGDQIVITGTQGSTSDEVRTIQSIDGTIVQLNEALQLDHIPPKTDLNVYVANTTRNVEFVSENSEIRRRGHIMFMHQLNVNVKNTSFNELGRTDKSRELDDLFFEFAEDVVGNETSAGVVFTTEAGERTNMRGRYAVHFHRGGNDPSSQPALIECSVVNGSPGWGFVNHSGHVNMVNNVSYGVKGAAFYTEAGDEIGSMVGNIAIRTVSPTFTLDDGGAIDPDLEAHVQSFGVDGDSYWLSGHLVSMRDNVSAGASGHGIIIWSDGLVEEDRGRATVKTANIANGHL
ncbi:MAG: G8 domain-containing protein, partial [Lacipirellulaceae bacterium]